MVGGMGGQGGIKKRILLSHHQLMSLTRTSFLVHTVQLKPKIKAHFSVKSGSQRNQNRSPFTTSIQPDHWSQYQFLLLCRTQGSPMPEEMHAPNIWSVIAYYVTKLCSFQYVPVCVHAFLYNMWTFSQNLTQCHQFIWRWVCTSPWE